MPTEPPVIVGVGLTVESSYVIEKVTGLVGDPDRVIAVHVLERNPLAYTDDAAAVLEKLFAVLLRVALLQQQQLSNNTFLSRGQFLAILVRREPCLRDTRILVVAERLQQALQFAIHSLQVFAVWRGKTFKLVTQMFELDPQTMVSAGR